MLTNCFRFAPRDSVPGLIAKICKYLKDHPGWSEAELEEQIKQFIGQTGVESFNGRTGVVLLNEDDVNNLKIASAYFAEGDETIDELDLLALYNQGIRFVFTNWNEVTSGYDLSFVLDYFSGSNDVVYYPMATGSGGGGNIVSVNGKTGIVELSLSDILGDSGAQVKLCTATEFTSTTLATWNAYYESGYRLVCVINNESTAVDFFYVLKQDTNNHQPIMISSGSGESAVTSVNTMIGAVTIPVVDVSEGDSQDPFAKIFIDEKEDYPTDSSYTLPIASPTVLGGVKPAAKTEDMTQAVGVDAAGLLFTAPSAATGEVGEWKHKKVTITEGVSSVTIELDGATEFYLVDTLSVTDANSANEGSNNLQVKVDGVLSYYPSAYIRTNPIFSDFYMGRKVDKKLISFGLGGYSSGFTWSTNSQLKFYGSIAMDYSTDKISAITFEIYNNSKSLFFAVGSKWEVWYR